MTIVFFFIHIHQFTLFTRRHQPFIQDTTKKTNSVCCVQFKNNNECTYHVWRLLVSHHCLPSNNVPSSFVLCDENTIWWTFFTNVWIWGHTGKVLELKRLCRVILEDAFHGQRFNSGSGDQLPRETDGRRLSSTVKNLVLTVKICIGIIVSIYSPQTENPRDIRTFLQSVTDLRGTSSANHNT